MRRASYTPTTASQMEPLIVVEESGLTDEDEDEGSNNSRCSTPQSPALNQYLLSPYRDVRKSSLPTPSCTTGITASQVRRLSEHGTDAAPSPREQAFLATLSTAATQAPGGRRHSVVTISRAPQSLFFGRGRRESIAAFSTPNQGRILQGGRRDSTSSMPRPPSTSNLGSQFNLQLDIMDDIAEMKAARKVKLKMWNTPSQEQVCEVEATDVPSTSTAPPPVRYHTSGESRRYSEFTSSSLPAPPPAKRRASEQVPGRSGNQLLPGIVCSNTDLISILSSLASSAQEINQRSQESPPIPVKKESPPPKVVASLEQKRTRMKESRSNSFDVSMLLSTVRTSKPAEKVPASWFVRRHQPKKTETEVRQKPNEPAQVTCIDERKVEVVKKKEAKGKDGGKVVWDERSGSVVDAQVLGSAIEVFLAGGSRRSSGETQPGAKKNGKSGAWFPKDDEATASSDSCESSSICSTLKDLFVK